MFVFSFAVYAVDREEPTEQEQAGFVCGLREAKEEELVGYQYAEDLQMLCEDQYSLEGEFGKLHQERDRELADLYAEIHTLKDEVERYEERPQASCKGLGVLEGQAEGVQCADALQMCAHKQCHCEDGRAKLSAEVESTLRDLHGQRDAAEREENVFAEGNHVLYDSEEWRNFERMEHNMLAAEHEALDVIDRQLQALSDLFRGLLSNSDQDSV